MIGSTLVSIRPRFARRIYSRRKAYELRKTKPNLSSPRLFLFETNGVQQASGLIVVSRIWTDSPAKIWARVGSRGTERNRFFHYFAGCRNANALEIHSVLRFVRPIPLADMREVDSRFTVPQGYCYLPTDARLHRLLFIRAIETVQTRLGGRLTLRELQAVNIKRLGKLVKECVGPHYGEINPDFLSSLVSEKAPGFSSLARQVYEVHNHSRLVGFTTLILKAGNCVKTGPTLLEKAFRRRGLGTQLRVLLDRALTSLGYRKVFCTCPVGKTAVTRYLEKAGYVVEATLRQQYQKGSDEYVFAKMLNEFPTDAFGARASVRRTASPVLRVDASKRYGGVSQFIRRTMDSHYFEVDQEWVDAILESWQPHPTACAMKYRKLFVGYGGAQPLAALITTPKRGRSVKLLMLTETSDETGLQRVLTAAESCYRKRSYRKFYSYISSSDSLLQRVFLKAGYRAEGLLREPYRAGNDFIVYAKFAATR